LAHRGFKVQNPQHINKIEEARTQNDRSPIGQAQFEKLAPKVAKPFMCRPKPIMYRAKPIMYSGFHILPLLVQGKRSDKKTVVEHILGPITPAENSNFLPIISNIGRIKITDSYHKFLGLTRIRDNMALC
jgi:hypothetical protein